MAKDKKDKEKEEAPEEKEEDKKKEDKKKPEGEAAAEDAEGAEGEGGAPKKGKKKLLFIAIGAVVVIIIVVVVLLTTGGKKKLDEHGNPIVNEEDMTDEQKAAKAKADLEASKPVYYELPEFLVNLNSTTQRVSFLKMSVTLELKDVATVAVMDANKPRIQDIFNTYLRELRPADIQGSQGIYRLRTELISRLNSTIEEGAVKDILFGEIIVQ